MPTSDYTITPDGLILRASDGAFIPVDPENVDYRAYLAAQAGGQPPPVQSDPHQE